MADIGAPSGGQGSGMGSGHGYGGDEGNLGDAQEGQGAVSGDPSGISNKDFNDLAARAWGAATKSSPSIGYGSGQVDPGLAQAAGLIGIKDWGSPAKTNVSLTESYQHQQTRMYQNLIDDVDQAILNKTINPNMLNKVRQHDAYLTAQRTINPTKFGDFALKAISPFSMGLTTLGPAFKNKAVDLGFVDDTTLQDIIDGINNSVDKPEGMGTDEDSNAEFWSLMNVARDNPQIFSSLSGEDIHSLVMDPAKFWKFYEENLYNV